MKKKVLAVCLAALMAIPTLAGCGSGDSQGEGTTDTAESSESGESSGDDEITLTIWDWDEAHLTHMTEWYHEKYPNVNFETLVVGSTDYMQKLQSALASGSGVPDIILSEIGYRGKVFDLGILEDLSQEPYNLDPSQMFDFAVELGTGQRRAVWCRTADLPQRICVSERPGKRISGNG